MESYDEFKKYMTTLSHEVHTDIMKDVSAAYTALMSKFGAGNFTPSDVTALTKVICEEREERAAMAREIMANQIRREIQREAPHRLRD